MQSTMISYSTIPNTQSYFYINPSGLNNYQDLNSNSLISKINKYHSLNTNLSTIQTLETLIKPNFNSITMNSISKNIKNNEKQKKRIQKNIFTIEEDRKLIELHSLYKDDWKKISEFMTNRTLRQCKERYFHYLSPQISLSQWSEEEDELLIQKVNEVGKKWKTLELFFNGRTEISIRNRWNMIERKHKKEIKKQAQKQLINQKENSSKNFKTSFSNSLNHQNNAIKFNTNQISSTNDETKKSYLLSIPEFSALPNPFHGDKNVFNNDLDKNNFDDSFQNGIFKEEFSLENIFDADLNFESDAPQNFL